MKATDPNLHEKFDITGRKISLKHIKPHPLNPRREFDEAELRSLADSMNEVGLLEPVIVRKLAGSQSGYELIAGERRLRAALLAGWEKIAAIVKDVSDSDALAMQLVENLQRVDLNPMELARGLQQLASPESEGGCGKTAQEVGKLVGKCKEWVRVRLQLTNLPQTWQSRIVNGEISMSCGLLVVPYAKQPEFLGRLEMDMVQNPWAYRTVPDFTNSLRQLASSEGIAGSLHHNARRTVQGQTRKSPEVKATQRPPAAPRVLPLPTREAQGPAPGNASRLPTAAAPADAVDVDRILVMIAEIESSADLERVEFAIAERREAISTRLLAN